MEMAMRATKETKIRWEQVILSLCTYELKLRNRDDQLIFLSFVNNSEFHRLTLKIPSLAIRSSHEKESFVNELNDANVNIDEETLSIYSFKKKRKITKNKMPSLIVFD